MPGRMTELMQRGAVPVDGFEIGLRRRDLHIVFGWCIECAISTDPKWNSAGLDQGFDRGFDQASRRWRRSGGDTVGQIFALIGVEYGKSFEEWNRLRFFAGLGSAPFFVIRHETIGVDDCGAALSLANVAAERERLTKCEPTLPGKSAFDHGSPENEDVNATVLPVGRRIFRHRQRRFCRGRTPGLNPGDASGLKFGNDLVGDFVIEVRPVLAGARASSRFDIAGLRDGRREPLSQLVTRHGKTQPALLL